MTTYGSGGVVFGPDWKQLIWQAGENVYARATLTPEARVLDVGGGQDPHPAADVVVDKFVRDNKHRMAQADIALEKHMVLVRPDGSEQGYNATVVMVEADGAELPFPDKSFDFIVCKDTLEHVDDPAAMLKELSRVGKSGYIDVPRIQSEFLWPQGKDVHKWVFDERGGELVAWSLEGFESPFGRILHDLFVEREDLNEAWCKGKRFFHLARFWRDSVGVRIAGNVEEIIN